ncbi:hypothetical protein NMG60_11001898 [Bertholletia excelsa]
MSFLKYRHASLCQFVAYSRFRSTPSSYPANQDLGLILNPQNFRLNKRPLALVRSPSDQRLTITKGCRHCGTLDNLITSDLNKDDKYIFKRNHKPQQVQEDAEGKSFWGAVGLIIGTAVGPGMLGLPAATIKCGLLPSTFAILFSWVYVISSIILVVELSFMAMEEDNVSDVSFTGLATKGLGNQIGGFVALVYASLSFSLLVACVAGIGSMVSQWFPGINPVIAHALFPFIVGVVVQFSPFKVIDAANRFLCLVMVFAISSLVVTGFSAGRMNILGSLSHISWDLSSVLPAIPVSVLTLGFHVITPFVCKIAGNSVKEARKAVLLGGVVPLIMVLLWNTIVLGLGGMDTTSFTRDPISVLLSVNSSALSAVQGFAFSALATSLIGYAISFPKQVLDTLELIIGNLNLKEKNPSCTYSVEDDGGKAVFATYSSGHGIGNMGKISYSGSRETPPSEVKLVYDRSFVERIMMPIVLGIAIVIGCFFPSIYSKALDFAGLYANCFLFGILPPVMTYIYQSRKGIRSSILPGGEGALLLLFVIAVTLGVWH